MFDDPRWQQFFAAIQRYQQQRQFEQSRGQQFLQALQQRFGTGGAGGAGQQGGFPGGNFLGGAFGQQRPGFGAPQGSGGGQTLTGTQGLEALLGGARQRPGYGTGPGPTLQSPGGGGQGQVGPGPRSTLLPPGRYTAFV